MKKLLINGLRAAAAMLALTALPARAADSDLAFTVEISGDTNVPTFTFTNNCPLLNFNLCQIALGDTGYDFDGNTTSVTAPAGGSARIIIPLAGTRTDRADIGLTGFGPGTSFSVDLDLDPNSGDSFVDYRNILFNNGVANA